jgi:hypothetical protein
MSPEQLAGEQLDHRTDIYSLGLLLFNALTGELPYPRVTSKETLVRRLTARPRTLAEIRPKVAWPAALQRVLDRALAPEVADRYDNAADLGRDVVAAVVSPTEVSSAATTLVSGPVAPAVRRPRSRRHDAPIPRAVLWRALPWTAALAALFFAAVLFAARQLRPREHRTAMPVARDSMPTRIAVVQQAVPAPLPPVVTTATARDTTHKAPTTPASPASLDHETAKTKHHPVPTQPPNVKPAEKPPAAAKVDTTHQMPAPAEDRGIVAAREIRSHIARMKQRFDSGDMRGARQELGEAASMLSIVRDLDPDPEHVMALQRELAQGVRDIIADCYRMRADSTLPQGVRCENLSPAANRFRGRRRQSP